MEMSGQDAAAAAPPRESHSAGHKKRKRSQASRSSSDSSSESSSSDERGREKRRKEKRKKEKRKKEPRKSSPVQLSKASCVAFSLARSQCDLWNINQVLELSSTDSPSCWCSFWRKPETVATMTVGAKKCVSTPRAERCASSLKLVTCVLWCAAAATVWSVGRSDDWLGRVGSCCPAGTRSQARYSVITGKRINLSRCVQR